MERLTLLAWSLNVEKFPWRIRCDGEEPKFSWKHRGEVNQAPSNTWRVQQSRSARWNGSLCLGFTPQKSCRANQTNNQRTFTACCVFVFCFFLWSQVNWACAVAHFLVVHFLSTCTVPSHAVSIRCFSKVFFFPTVTFEFCTFFPFVK